MAGPEPGAEFLQRRLARATAVPPAERSPEVAAFVESMQLLRKARELLPLTPAGRPALPDTPATGRKVGWLQPPLIKCSPGCLCCAASAASAAAASAASAASAVLPLPPACPPALLHCGERPHNPSKRPSHPPSPSLPPADAARNAEDFAG